MFHVDFEDKIKMVPIYMHDKCSWSYCANNQYLLYYIRLYLFVLVYIINIYCNYI